MSNIHIENSSHMSRTEFLDALYHADRTMDYVEVMAHRSERSILEEWASHKLLYDLHILRSHTESVDINYPQKWYVSVAYFIVGEFALIFYK